MIKKLISWLFEDEISAEKERGFVKGIEAYLEWIDEAVVLNGTIEMSTQSLTDTNIMVYLPSPIAINVKEHAECSIVGNILNFKGWCMI